MQLKNLADLDEILSTLLVLNIEQPKIPEPDYLEIILNSQLLTAKVILMITRRISYTTNMIILRVALF